MGQIENFALPHACSAEVDSLEAQLKRELDESRIVDRFGDLAEVGRVNVGDRSEELRMIEDVEEFGSEFQVGRFPNWDREPLD